MLAIQSFRRSKEQQARVIASNAYVLADLIGTSVARLFSKSNKMPEIEKVYPSLFKKEAEAEDWKSMKDKLLAYADAHNKKYERERE